MVTIVCIVPKLYKVWHVYQILPFHEVSAPAHGSGHPRSGKTWLNCSNASDKSPSYPSDVLKGIFCDIKCLLHVASFNKILYDVIWCDCTCVLSRC